ncbi:MAG: DUF2065 domain-containing protein [Deltaproteobacteria bacterium]|jgi:uncharacterized protein
MEFFLCVFGMVLVVEGLPYFGFPDKMKTLMKVMRQQDDATLRIMGGSLMLLGLIILFLARTVLGQG